ncbi:protein WEAK CHLOROPLAST MOVEMENT UNDER BLUE LIGHT 1-like [Rutidosis leptorrhynchoides]|uniref:protein WEAK CHLOROPLAST MOVEMENT UNDER BLUE LIGHT 1-like n=1 Tax=Rutidosis leptorrhynchoides TaxID=125765 RepID=UPI003A99A97D
MDEDKFQGKNTNSISTPEINHGYQSSPDVGSEDTIFLSPEASSGRQKSVDVSPNVNNKDGSNKQDESNVHIDTAAPFESVKEAVSKFGAIVDWKAHKAQTNERRRFIDQELERAQDEIPIYKQKSEAAEQEKDQVLRDLDTTKRLIRELKINLERAQTEERQAKQDSELAQLRIQEMEQGITDESSVAAKTQLEVAKARHLAAAEELVSAKNELEETRKDYAILAAERDSAQQKALEAVSTAKEIESEVENLTIQLITTKESIESTHALHLEAEEHRFQEGSETDQEELYWDQELKRTEEEFEKLKEQIVKAKDMKSKLETASTELQKLKDELAIYMQGKMPEEDDDKFTRKDIQSGIAIAKKNLEEVNNNIKRTNEEIMCLKTAEKSLTAKLESEKQVLTNIRKQKGLGAGAVVNLESDLKRSRLDLENIKKKEKEAREKLVELPKRLQKVTEETENAKSLAEGAGLVLSKAKEAAEQAKSGAGSVSSRLAEIQKEIDAARAKEKLALGAINALHESESARGSKKGDPKGGVTISLEEYYELSKQAHEAQEVADKRVADAMAKIDEAKDSEMQNLNKLTQLNSELASRKEALNVALEKAEMAKECTLNIEEELKKRKGENDPNQKSESRGGLFHALSRKASEKVNRDSPSHNAGPSVNNESSTKSSEPEGDSSQDGKGFFRRRINLPKFSLMTVGKGTGKGTEKGTGTGKETEKGTETGKGIETETGKETEIGKGTEKGTETGKGTGKEKWTGIGMGTWKGIGTGKGTEKGTETGKGTETEIGKGTEKGTGKEKWTGMGTWKGTGTTKWKGTGKLKSISIFHKKESS